MPLIKERLKLLSEAPDLMRFLLKDELEYDVNEAIPKKMDAQATLRMLREARILLQGAAQRSDEENEETFRARAEELEVKLGSLLMPLRVAITGSRVSPPLFGSIRLLGEEKSLERVDKVIQLLEDEEEHG
jgi:glutamyl-tRNA synthetase